MEKENKKEEIQSRREFFKASVKKVLPALGAIALSGLPFVSKAVNSDSGKGQCYGCYSKQKHSCYIN